MSVKSRFGAAKSRFTNDWAKRENSYEDRNISLYEKLLGIKKRRRKNKLSNKLPLSFVNDGLDYVLGVLNREDEEGNEGNEGEHEMDALGDANSTDSESESETPLSRKQREISKKHSDEAAQRTSKTKEKVKAKGKEKEKKKAEETTSKQLKRRKVSESEEATAKKRVRFSGTLQTKEISDDEATDTEPVPAEKPEQRVIARQKAESSTNVTSRKSELLKTEAVSERLARLVRASLNRLSASNIAAILSQLESTVLQRDFSRAETVQAVAEYVLEACAFSRRQVLERIAFDYTLLVSALRSRPQMEQLAARLVERVCCQLNEVRERLTGLTEADEDRSKLLNAIQFLCALLHMHVVHSVLIFSLLKRFLLRFAEIDIDAILLVVKRCGMTLRKENPEELKSFLDELEKKQKEKEAQECLSKRARMLLEMLVAVKNNNHRKVAGHAETNELVLEYSAALRRLGGKVGEDELHVTFDEFLEAETRGRWWLVGCHWSERDKETKSTTNKQKSSKASEDKVEEASRKLRLNTDVRKQLFRLLVTCHDAEDAFVKVTQFAAARKASGKSRAARCRTVHEAIRLACTCAMRERTHNAFYAQLISRLASTHRTYKRYTLLVFWDHLRSMQLDSATWLGSENEDESQCDEENWLQETSDARWRKVSNLASLLVALLRSGALNLALTLKPVAFAEMQPAQLAFLRRVFVQLLQLDEPTCVRLFAPLADHAFADRLLRDAVSMFLNHFMRKPAKRHDRTPLVERIKLLTEHVLVNAN